MPNPFLRSGAANTSKTDVDRPTAITPIPERVEGNNFAYRGMEAHGVEPNAVYEPIEDYHSEEDTLQDYEPELVPETPVPVYVVQSGGRELRRFRVTRALAGPNTGNASMVIGGDPLRRKVTIVNVGADLVYIGHEQATTNAMHAFPLAANGVFETDSNDSAVWAVSSTANASQLAVKTEYSVLVGND